MRLPIIFYNATPDPEPLIRSVKDFISLNACEMLRFKVIVYLHRPDHSAVELVKRELKPLTPYLTAGSKPPCIPCILSKHKTRYGIVVPSNYFPIAPIWPYIADIRKTLRDYPDLRFIRLTPDFSPTNTPRVAHKHTRSIYITHDQPLPAGSPVLLKSKIPGSNVSGILKPIVFTRV
jgi:hypothetical protein